MTTSRPRAVAPAVVLLAVLGLLLSGCGVFGDGSDDPDRTSSASAGSSGATPAPASPSASGPMPRPPAGLADFYTQELTWKPCRGSDRCATLRVPLDYAQPSGRVISLSLLKVPARDRSARIGSLVVNPGGPGGSGVDYAQAADRVFGAALRKVYDVVGFDPRGVGTSTPVRCGSDALLNRYVDADPSPDTAAERKSSDSLLRRIGQACLTDSGRLARHVSTVEVAKDLDVLRGVLGERRLDYFGASYGTFIGATYADLFPRRVGRMVLDGALDPRSSATDVALVQAHGFETALRAYVGACVDRGGCFLGSTVDRGIRRIQRFLAQVEQTPLRTSTGPRLSGGEALYGLIVPLYDKTSWPYLDTALRRAFAGDGGTLLAFAGSYLERDGNGHYTTNSFAVFNVVSCLDRDDGLTSAQVERNVPRFERASPTFGRIFAYGASSCRTWPIHSGSEPAAVTAKGSPPILVIGTTRDPATPLVWAQALAKQLPKGVLITRDGDGHTGYRQGSACVDSAVERYLVAGTVPRGPVSCS